MRTVSAVTHATSAARVLDRASPLPLWAQLQEDLLRRLRGGEFSETVPPESALVEQYGVSRHTVREALRRLREAGVLESGRGRTTRVRQMEQPLGHLYSLFRSVEQQGMAQRSQVLREKVTVNAVAAEALALPTDAELVHLERLRLADDRPLAHDRVWLPASLARPVLGSDWQRTALYDELARRCDLHITGARERITAVCPDTLLRRLLELPHDVACLRVERVGTASGRPVEYRVTSLRGDRFSLTTES